MAQTREERNAVVAASLAKLRAYRKLHSLCRECGEPSKPGSVQCRQCLSERAADAREKYVPKRRARECRPAPVPRVPKVKMLKKDVQAERIERMWALSRKVGA